MLDSAYDRELRKGKRYNTNPRRILSGNGSFEGNVAGYSSENVKREILKIHTSIQQEVNEQIKGFIAPPPSTLAKELTQGMLTTYPRSEHSPTSGRAVHQSERPRRSSSQ